MEKLTLIMWNPSQAFPVTPSMCCRFLIFINWIFTLCYWYRLVPSKCSPEVWQPNRYRSHKEEHNLCFFCMESHWRSLIFYGNIFEVIFSGVMFDISNDLGIKLLCMTKRKCLPTATSTKIMNIDGDRWNFRHKTWT